MTSPPLVCKTCSLSPTHPALDARGEAFYCAHREVLVIRDEARGRWIVLQGVDQPSYRRLVGRCETDARLLAERGLGYSSERGIFVASASNMTDET